MIKGTAYVLISIGILFNVFSALALIRFSDVYTRLLAALKCAMCGTCAIMLGVFFMNGLTATGIKALLCAAFVVITAPAAAHALTRAAHRAANHPAGEHSPDTHGKQ